MQGFGWKLKGISASFEKGSCPVHSVDVGIKPVLLKCSERKTSRDKMRVFKWLKGRRGNVESCNEKRMFVVVRKADQWLLNVKKKKKGKVILLQPGVAERVGRGIALLFHDRGTRRG